MPLQVKPAVDKAVNEFAARGFRSLGVARAEGDGKWQFLGVLPLFDPPREDAKSTIATAQQMGVKVKMVTGDALAIARETAKTLGMGTNILDASSLGDEKQQATTAVAKAIEKADGFAQVFPEHKFHIVDDLQKRGHIVGMTGDGVNDAPALKKADCGIAVSGATDAARAAAAIVLMTPGLSVIIDAIKESRRIFQRMNSYAIYRIAETLRVLLFMTLAILVFNFYPLTAVMIVMLALLNDGAILSIAYDNVHYKDQPEAWNMRLVLGIATVLGVIGVVAAFGLFYLGERVFHLDRAHIQTLMYLKLSVAGHLTIFLTRTRGPFWSIRPARILWIAVLGTQTLATLIAVYGVFMTPLGWGWALFVWGYALAWFLVNDRVKLLAYRIFDASQRSRSSKPKLRHRLNGNAASTIGRMKMKINSKDFRVAGRTRGRSQKVADEGRSRVQVEGAIQKTAGKARCATEFATAASLRVQPLCRPADLSGDGCGGKRRRHQARDVRGQSPGLPGVQLQAPSADRIGTRLSLAHHPRSAGTRADRHLQPILLRGGTDRPRASRDSTKRSDPGHAASRQEGLARPVSFDRGFGEAPPRQRNPHHQVLPPPLEGGAAKALSGAHRRAGKELEIQPCGHRGEEILEALHEGV